MQISVDMDDYVSILSFIRMLGRRLAPILEGDLPALLGHRAPSGLRRVAAADAGDLEQRHQNREVAVRDRPTIEQPEAGAHLLLGGLLWVLDRHARPVDGATGLIFRCPPESFDA